MWKKIRDSLLNLYSKLSLRYVIWGAFTITALLITILVSTSFYQRFSEQLLSTAQRHQTALIEQVSNTLNSDLRNMMKVSDSIYYSVLRKEEQEEGLWDKELQLLYDTNKDYIENIALFSERGELLNASPAALLKDYVDVTKERWFYEALEERENMHFSNTHVQNLFVRSDYSYKRVVSLSRSVQFTRNHKVQKGVLLIDIKYEEIAKIFDNLTLGADGYIYITDNTGELIYHPKHQLVEEGIAKENHKKAARHPDGSFKEKFQGETRLVTVKSVGYTGWKLVGVVSNQVIPLTTVQGVLFYMAMALLFMVVLSVINSFISIKVTDPIKELEENVKEMEEGNLDSHIQKKGCLEIRHLGKSIDNMQTRINQLMKDIVKEEEQQRRNELNLLQSQINPHFLYNTLDVVVWLVENNKPRDAVRALTALARFFRIGLNKGKTIISVADEVEHVRNYLTIQKMRYVNKFEYFIEVDEQVQNMSSLKLILQPMVENAIGYGMEFKDGDGEIYIRIALKDTKVIMEVEDNGLGIVPDRLEALCKGEVIPSKKGSGIGIKNVNERIQLYYGKDYGVEIETEPDEGTKITIYQPAIPYEEGLKF